MTALLTIVSIAAAFVIAALAVGLVRGGISDMGQTDGNYILDSRN